MLVLLATQKGRKELGEIPGATLPLYIPAGGVPWGDAVGWADTPSSRTWHDGSAQPTHSTALDAHGVPTMAAGEAVAAQQRHTLLGNDKPVYGVLFTTTRSQWAPTRWLSWPTCWRAWAAGRGNGATRRGGRAAAGRRGRCSCACSRRRPSATR